MTKETAGHACVHKIFLNMLFQFRIYLVKVVRNVKTSYHEEPRMGGSSVPAEQASE